MSRLLPIALLLLLSACASIETTPPTALHQPMSARADSSTITPPQNGAIYQVAMARPLFEDRRARMIGDTLIINLVEKTSANKASSASASRDSSISSGITSLLKLPFSALAGLSAKASSSSDVEGKGAAGANNTFTGTIAVTVVDVLANGNLLVSGEKQIAINQGNEFIRFSGVVNPVNLTAANTVQSTQVADARMEYKGNGYTNDSQLIGWLQRFFFLLLPL